MWLKLDKKSHTFNIIATTSITPMLSVVLVSMRSISPVRYPCSCCCELSCTVMVSSRMSSDCRSGSADIDCTEFKLRNIIIDAIYYKSDMIKSFVPVKSERCCCSRGVAVSARWDCTVVALWNVSSVFDGSESALILLLHEWDFGWKGGTCKAFQMCQNLY